MLYLCANNKTMAYNKIDEKNKKIIVKMLSDKLTIKTISDKLNVSIHQVFKIKHNIEVYERGNVIRIERISDSVFNDIHNIAKNLDMKLPNFLKIHLRKIVEKYPADLKQPVI